MVVDIIQEQIAYYSARANEYDEWFYRIGRYDYGEEINKRWFNEVALVKRALHQIRGVGHILELACGTGIWTEELLSIGQKITALDASLETIEINRRKLGAPNVSYRQIDLFSWEPDDEYDLVFFSFWLSHVPPTLLDSFLAKVYKSVRPGGKLFIVDSRSSNITMAKDETLQYDRKVYESRKLNDNQEFQIVKIYYQPDFLHDKLTKIGFNTDVKVTENYSTCKKSVDVGRLREQP